MATAHQKLAVFIVLLTLGGTLWSAYLAYRSRVSVRLRQLAWITETAICLQAVFGIVLAIGGSRPADPLHFLYGPISLFALPAGLQASRSRTDGRGTGLLFVVWIVTLALALRAVGTGGGLT